MKLYYIYAFLNSLKPGKFIYDDLIFDFEPFYIGKGTGNRIISSKHDRESQFKVNKISKIEKYGGEIISVKLYDFLENKDALIKEIEIINKIGRRDLGNGPLVNQTNGGDGRSESKQSDETKKKISETKKKQGIKAYSKNPLTEEKRKHLSLKNKGENNPMFGRNQTDDVKESQSLRVSGENHPMFNKKHSDETIKKIKDKIKKLDRKKILDISNNSKKPVLQFTLNGDFIKEFDSIKAASQETGLSESIIGKCCRGKIKNPRKFYFKFKSIDSHILKNSFKIKVGDTFTLNGQEYKLIRRFKKSCLVENLNTIITIRGKDCEILFEKNII